MFKLKVVGGPNRGTSYKVHEGENSVGRVEGNDIVLSSSQVSKKHCVLVVDNTGVTVHDNGSSNGTFVNGVLTRIKKLLPGDRLSVGEYVLELAKYDPLARPKQAHNAQPDNVVQLYQPGVMPPISGVPVGQSAAFSVGMQQGAAAPMQPGVPSAPVAPVTFQEKVKFYFEAYILNFVYNLNEKHEWRTMVAGMFVIVTAASALLSVFLVLERVREKLAEEAAGRAFLLARQIVDRNAPFIYERLETKVDVSFIEKEPGVISAYLVDMEGRILAPGRKLNQYLTEPNEAAFSAAARVDFGNRDALERKRTTYSNSLAVAVPLKIFNSQLGKNVTVALGLVFFDQNMVLFDSGTEALAYIQALILSAIVAVLIYFSLYRLTLRPLQTLNDDIDQVLKGSAATVSKKFKMEEIHPLIDVVNAALQRIPSSASPASSAGGASDVEIADAVSAVVKFASERASQMGVMMLSGERRILHINAFMEEITGIRNDSAIGSDVGSVARDAAFASFVDDLLGKTPAFGIEPVGEDFEFSGTMYRIESLAASRAGNPLVYVLIAVKQQG